MTEIHKTQVRLLGADLGLDCSLTTTCPFCNAAEKKFSIKRTASGFLYNCYRASCGSSGFASDSGEIPEGAVSTKPKRRPWINPTYNLLPVDVAFFEETWGIQDAGDYMKFTADNRYAFKLRPPSGMLVKLPPYGIGDRGWLIRSPVWKGVVCHRETTYTGPKSVSYFNDPDGSHLAWTKEVTVDSHIVLCEDFLSAIKVSQSCRKTVGVSLSGVHLDYAGVEEILALNPLCVTICLDPDAQKAAYRMLQKWGLLFNACQIISFDKDPKDISASELCEKLTLRW